ncbi:hypothetical protein S40288_11473 [Stachybotrys chartarum IBT 40288]|nr:hypothetical protein S40288_11473 [Stachybotrys chartarum IBT 40288]
MLIHPEDANPLRRATVIKAASEALHAPTNDDKTAMHEMALVVARAARDRNELHYRHGSPVTWPHRHLGARRKGEGETFSKTLALDAWHGDTLCSSAHNSGRAARRREHSQLAQDEPHGSLCWGSARNVQHSARPRPMSAYFSILVNRRGAVQLK